MWKLIVQMKGDANQAEMDKAAEELVDILDNNSFDYSDVITPQDI